MASNSLVHTEKTHIGILNIRCLIFRFPNLDVSRPYIPGELLVPHNADPTELGYQKLNNGLWAVPASDVKDALQRTEKNYAATNTDV